MSDSEVWQLARENGMTIISKDADFSNRIIVSEPPPKVIHIKTGNMRLGEFRDFAEKLWPEIQQMSERFKLVNVFNDRIEGIN